MHKNLLKLVISPILISMFFFGCFNQQEVVSQKQEVVKQKDKITSSEELKDVWQKETAEVPKTKEFAGAGTTILMNKLKITEQSVIDSETERILTSEILLVDFHQNAFDSTLLNVLIFNELEANNKEKLLTIISRRCPTKLGNTAIELYFAIKSINNINLFFEAYKQAKTPDAKYWTLFTLRRIFRKQRKQFPDNDEKFIEESQKWFGNNKKNLTYDPYYRIGYPELTFELKKWYRIFKPEVKLRPDSPFASPTDEIREIMELFIIKKPKKQLKKIRKK
jgi:hypothetical protein